MEVGTTSWIFTVIHPGHRSPVIQTRDALSFEPGVVLVTHSTNVGNRRLTMRDLGGDSIVQYVHFVYAVQSEES